MGRYLSEFNVGDKFITDNLTVTETHVVLFSGITKNFNPVHVDQTYAEQKGMGYRIANGMLSASIAQGLWSSMGLVEGTAIAALANTWEYKGTVKFNDTIHSEVTVTEIKRSKSKPDRGIMVVSHSVKNQDGKEVLTGTTTAMLRWEKQD